jgi:hypothetical protein
MEQETKTNPNITKTQWLGFIRHTLTMIGGGLVASGHLTETELMEAIGFVVGIIGFLWSYAKNRR